MGNEAVLQPQSGKTARTRECKSCIEYSALTSRVFFLPESFLEKFSQYRGKNHYESILRAVF